MGIVAATKSVEQTRDLGATLAELARPGDLVLLAGDLGAGKTAFAQGFGRGLGVPGPITSPTFTLAREYEGGRLRLHHLDVYRLEQLEEVLDVGLPELLDDDAVTLIEWGDTITRALPRDYLEVRITFGDGDEDRMFELTPFGSSWQARMRAVGIALAAWATPSPATSSATTDDSDRPGDRAGDGIASTEGDTPC
jgi:tRNA threonylcarbamoyladenosine biosynthesis protein TsaE